MHDLMRSTSEPTALIVDDDPAMRLLLRHALEKAGLAVEEAADGREGLSRFETFPAELVLLDVAMPGLDGFATCSRLRNLPGGQDTAVIMVTGLDDMDSIQQAYDVGATDFITKPVNWPILEYRIRYLLRSHQAFESLRTSEARLAEVQRIAKLGHWEWHISDDRLVCSDEIYRVFALQRPAKPVTYEGFLRAVHPDDQVFVSNAVDEALNTGKALQIDHRVVLPDGSVRSVHEQAEVQFDRSGKPVRMQGTAQDVTERMKSEEQIRFLAYYDVLTGLPNRQLFAERADRALRDARRNGSRVGLFYLDLDQFKYVNDTLGHSAGDELLKRVAQRLTDSIRESDTVAKAAFENESDSSLSRMGGDEFTILLTGLEKGQQAARVARRMLDNLSQPVRVGEQALYVTGSLGIAIYPADGEDVDTLLKNADTAMYHAKEQGRNRFQFFGKHMNQRASERLSMESKLKQALKRNEFQLHYQPQVDIKSGRILGLEALLRWHPPGMKLITADQLIPLAEEIGVILPIGEWVLETACAQLQSLREAGFGPLRMAINLTSRQFQQKDLERGICGVIDDHGLPRDCLALEFTETAVMGDVETSSKTLRSLKNAGFELSIDNFGTGYSSMSSLRRFPLDHLKIDRSFIQQVIATSSDAAIVSAIIALAKNLGLVTVAEGVESPEQLAFLRERDCDRFQGHLASRPIPREKLAAVLENCCPNLVD